MPLPIPKSGEKKQSFINRCMSSSGANKEFPDEDQRAAYCYTEWEERGDGEMGEKESEELEEDKMKKKEEDKKHKEKMKDHSFLPRADREMRMDFFGYLNDYPRNTLERKGDMLEQKFVETPEGYLAGRAIATNIGVFPYLLEDGSIRYELRSPEEVMKMDSLITLGNSVLTNNHPVQPVTVENQKGLNVGFIGDDIRSDPYHVSVPIVITDEGAIEDVKKGKRSLSAGYFCDLEMKEGTWMGIHYDAIQRNIEYNHLAIVDKGRAGDAAKIRLDSANGRLAMCDHTALSYTRREDHEMALKKITLDGVEYEAEARVIELLTQRKEKLDQVESKLDALTKERDTFKSDLDKMEADRDANKERADKAEADIKALQEARPDQAKLDEMVKSRLELFEAAKLAGVELKGDESDGDIRKAVILKISPDVKLDEKSEDYIQARFDSAVETVRKRKDDTKREFFQNPGEFDTEVKADEAHNNYIEYMKNRSHSENKE